MMKANQNLVKLGLISGLILATISCKKDKVQEEQVEPSAYRPYHLVLGQGSTGESMTYMQGVSVEKMGASDKVFSFSDYGFEVPSVRTARVFSSTNGLNIYNLNYGGGEVSKYSYKSGQEYSLILNTNVQAAIGTANPRWTKVDDNTALLHHVVTENVYDASGTSYERTKATIKIAVVNLSNMSLGAITEFEMPWNASEANQGIHVFRIDAPMIQGGKVFYGVGKRKYDHTTDENVAFDYTDVETLVLDFPSLTNPTTIRTNAGGAKGATNGYKTPVSYLDEYDDLYQISTSNGLNFLKISNGNYDESYTFKVDDILGHTCRSNGWFYVGNGVGYIPVLNADAGSPSTSNWYVVRVDIYNKTAVKMNIPFQMWLQQYQWGSVIDGKFYMALAPLGGEGNVYIFDPQSTSENGFEVGAKLKTGTDAFYIGLF